MSVYSENASQKNKSRLQTEQHHHLRRLYLELHCSSLFPPREVKKVPIANNIRATTKEATETAQENSCLTRGCMIANTIIAVPIFKTVLPSSLRPFTGFINTPKNLKRR